MLFVDASATRGVVVDRWLVRDVLCVLPVVMGFFDQENTRLETVWFSVLAALAALCLPFGTMMGRRSPILAAKLVVRHVAVLDAAQCSIGQVCQHPRSEHKHDTAVDFHAATYNIWVKEHALSYPPVRPLCGLLPVEQT